MTLEKLQEIFRKCWSKETAEDPFEWNQKNPAWGQCVPTSLVAQDLLGGDIIKGSAEIKSLCILTHHTWNRLPNGREIDFTKEQFPESAIFSKLGIIKNVEKIRPFLTPGEIKRYTLLKLAVENQIKCATS